MKTSYDNVGGSAKSTDGIGATAIISETGKSYSSDLHSKNNSILFSPQNFTTMEKSYKSTRGSFSLQIGSSSKSTSFLKSISLALVMLLVGIGDVWGQVSTYSFTNTSGFYTNVAGTTFLANSDDASSAVQNIGFTFNFNSTNFTQFVANSNGSIRFGTAAPTSQYTPLSTTSNTNAIAACARDGRSSGGVIRAIQGVAPNRVCVIQYTNFDLTYSSTANRVSFQIRLYETTNVVEIIYGGSTRTLTYTPQIGLRGSTLAGDFNNRTGSSANWAGNSAGTANSSTVTWSTTSFPSSGRIFRWTPPVIVSPTITSISPTSGCPGATITINGTNLTGATVANVRIGGTAVAAILTNTGTQITATVGAGTTGVVSVITGGGTANSAATFTVNSAPPTPVASAATLITSTTASANWAASAGATQYFLDVSTSPTFASFLPGYSNLNVGNVTTLALTGLTANTTYYYRVRASSGTCPSLSSGVISFFTGYCAASGTGASAYITNFVTTGGITNIANPTGLSAGGYGNFTAVSCSQIAAGTINFTLSYLSDPGTRIFVDWNNDLDFADANETVYSSNGYVVSTVAGSFVVPVGQASGNYRMRIVVDWNSTVPIACPVGINGEIEDYTLAVTCAPAQPSVIAGILTPEVGATQTYSVTNVAGVSYAWSFPTGWVINSGQGTNSVSVTVGANNGTISVTPSLGACNGTARTATTTIPNYRWKYISSNLGSATWTGGEARNISITIQNTGLATWNSTYPNNIGVRWNSTTGSLSGTPWNDYHVRTSVGSVAPGGQGTFTLAMEAKNAAAGPVYSTNLADGSYYLAFDVVSETQCWFSMNTGTCGPGNTVFYSPVQTISTVPTLSCTALTPFGNVCADATATNSFTVSGVNLTNNVSIAALSGYTYSTSLGGTYTSTLTLTPVSGAISQTVYVKFTPGATGVISGNIVVSCTGATSQNVAATGTGIQATTVNAGADFNLCSGQNLPLNGSTNATAIPGSVSATYNAGNGSSLYNAAPTTATNSSCPIPLAVNIPVGATITGVNVSYNMTAASGAYMSEQLTYLKCTSAGGASEATMATGVGLVGGTMSYTRSNLTIANAVTGGGTINFQLHAFRAWGGAGCEAIYNFVNNNSFTVTVNYTLNPTYAWSAAAGLTATNILNPICSVSSNTTYTLTVTGTNGCVGSDQVAVTVAGGSVPPNPTAAVSGATTINVGGTTTLTSTATDPVWYTAATGGTAIGTGTPFTTPGQCASGTATYYVEDNNGTCASNGRGAVSFTVRPILVSNPVNALICQVGGSVTLSSQLTGVSPSAITWSPNTALSAISGASTVASPTTTTVYTMNATVAGCPSAVSETKTVGVIDAVAFTPTSTPTAVCAGGTATLASNLASSGFTYTTTPISMSTAVSPVVLCNACGLDDGGWNNVPIPFTYNFFGNNYTTVNVGSNGVLQFGTSTGLGQYTYNSGNFPNVAYPPNVIAAAAVDLWLTGGSVRYFTDGIAPTRKFVIEYLNAAGYSGGSNTVQIKLCETTGIVEIHIPNASAFGGSANKVVGLQNLTQTVGATAYSSATTITNQAWKFIPGANYTFQWATAGANISGATATTYPTPALATPGTVTYSVGATNPNTQCTTTQSVNITVNSLPAAPNSSGNVTACSALGNQSLAVTAGVGETADWYAASTGGTVLASGDNVLSYSTATAGPYYAEAQNSTTGCVSATRTLVNLTVNPSPAAPTVTTPVSYCQGATPATLTATALGANTLNWYSAAPSYPAFTGATALGSAPTPTTSTAGTTNYYVSQVDPNNSCESPLALLAVTVNATPAAPVVSNPAAYCQGASASALSAPFIGGNTSYWYTVPTGGTGDAVAPIPSTATAGTTDYYVADRNNASTCEGSRSTITVTVNPTITASVSNSASSTSACGGGAITFTATPTNGGTPTYQWTLNGNPVGTNSATYTSNPATDNAVNYSGTWNNGSNQGTGLNPWAFSGSANTGQFIGNPSNDFNGTAGIGTTAHGIYATGNSYINTTRTFANPMQIGDELRFYWIFNWDANGGGKGFDLKSAGANIFTVINSGSSPAITVNGGATADVGYGTTPMYVRVTRISATQYSFSMTRRSDGSTYTTTFNSPNALDGVSFFIGNQNDGSGQRNLYFNGIEMRPLQANDNLVVSMTPSAQSCLASVAAVTSNTITLTSTASTPTVAIQSTASSAICPGTSVTFSVNSSANMGASPTYQWNLNGTPITGATNASLITTTLANNDQVTLTMTSSLSAVCLTQPSATSAAVTATVNNPTAITTQPVAAAACLGASQNFTVAATGTGTLTYQWKKNGSNVTGNGTANAATLTVSGIAAGDAADYTVDVIGTCGTVTSSVAALTLNTVTAISAQPSLVTQCAGTTANFSVTAGGQGTLSYQWRKDGTTLVGETNATLAVANIATLNAGQYSVVVSGGCGNVTSSNALLTVNPLTAISAQPTASTLCAGNTVNFSVTASGTGALTYQWMKDGINVGTNSASLSIVNSQAASAGTYTVDVTGTCGTVTSNSALLTVNPLTSITTQPVATSGCEGLNTTFSVVAAGTGALTYQWKFGGVNITGATDATYTISNTTAANNDGSYLVAVTGGCGVVNSNTVALSVFAQPTISVPTSTAYLCLNNTPVNITHTTTNVTDIASITGLPAGVTATYASNTITISGPAQAGLGTWNYVITPTGCATSASGPVSASGTISAIATAAPAAVASTVSVPLANGDLLWTGLTSPLWGVNSNWYEYNSTLDDFVAMIDNQPASSDRVFILPSTTSGICISSTNNTLINAAGTASDVYIGTGATMLIDAGQSLEVRGNWTNNGTFTPNATSTVIINGSGAQAIGGANSTTFTNLTVNKTSGLLTLNKATNVSGTLTMTSGNIASTNANLLKIGTSAAAPGSLVWSGGSVLGPIKRWFSGTADATQASGILPVGLSGVNRYAQVNYTSGLTTGGTITAEYIAGVCPILYSGLPTSVNGHMIQNYENEGYWSITPGTGAEAGDLNTAQYSLKLRGNALSAVTSVAAMSQLRMIKSASHTTWDMSGIGTNTGATGGVSDFTITNNDMTGFSWFNIGSGQISWLPVELTNFAANCNEKSQVDIKWSTASEQNSENFIIERSRDLTQWEYVSTVNAAGNSNYNIDYSTVDIDPLSGISYYRLVQVDHNGTEKIYGPISVSCAGDENGMVVFPNPTKGNFTVEISSTEIFTNAQLQITDLTGKVIDERSTNILEGKNQFTFEGLNLQLGTYIINLNSVNGKINPVRVVVN